jgi:hypothetical protein
MKAQPTKRLVAKLPETPPPNIKGYGRFAKRHTRPPLEQCGASVQWSNPGPHHKSGIAKLDSGGLARR